jgi:hypothetical protein
MASRWLKILTRRTKREPRVGVTRGARDFGAAASRYFVPLANSVNTNLYACAVLS